MKKQNIQNGKYQKDNKVELTAILNNGWIYLR